MEIADTSYVTVRRPKPEPLAIPDYEFQLYQQMAQGVTVAREAQVFAENATLAVLVIDNAFEYHVDEWLEDKHRRFGWEFEWHDSYPAAVADLYVRAEAER